MFLVQLKQTNLIFRAKIPNMNLVLIFIKNTIEPKFYEGFEVKSQYLTFSTAQYPLYLNKNENKTKPLLLGRWRNTIHFKTGNNKFSCTVTCEQELGQFDEGLLSWSFSSIFFEKRSFTN